MTGATHKEIKEKLASNQLKATYQRIVIYKALLNLEHPSAEDILEWIEEEYPSISYATIYKTLETFEKAGLVNRVQVSEGRYKYDANLESHNHLLCHKTGRIIDYKDHELEDLIYEHLKKKNLHRDFDIKSIQLQIDGELKNQNLSSSDETTST